MVGNAKDFFTSVKALKADWQLVGRSLYLGIKNIVNAPMQSTGSLLLGACSFVSFVPKTLIGFYKTAGR